ncbi:hypothetical protein HELRODRAFT_188652 [Helobdella robusta]|uniref:CAP-Gly domain-containing protein n=1 Tax=Helobdella robusta TaxID=6412 RepID=T1FQ81_HELRO|nr:hypothetical protein HELRODRAFT_188652 [Helobdella robusta]ESO02289.1 hypothetical protein HELRODRAFT_188652 [Helobdella robusta]
MENYDDGDSELTYRNYPIIHPPADLSPCSECLNANKSAEVSYFDPNCENCQMFVSHDASIAEMFAVLRQWTTAVQQSVKTVICQMLDCGAHVNDRDGLTDMTMLHYAVKSGARGMGNIDDACQIVLLLLSRGADPYIRCRWTNMAAIHYAVYFDVHLVLEILLNASKGVDVDSLCYEFDHGTPLHIACRTLALESTKVLLKYGADKSIKDVNGKLSTDWLPSTDSYEISTEIKKTVSELKTLLEKSPSNSTSFFSHTPKESTQISCILKSLDVKIGDKVFVGGVKTGILRYCGPTLFAGGFWAGIELDESIGKNNGSINGIQYFKCPPNYGIFAPISKISKQHNTLGHEQPPTRNHHSMTYSRIDLSRITSKIDSGLRQSKLDLSEQSNTSSDIEVNDRVLVAGKKMGTVRYVGETEFAPGLWYGIELYRPIGRNNGSVDGVQYFSCPANHGVFAPPFRIQRLDDAHCKKIQKFNLFKTPITTISIVHYIGSVDFAEGIWLGVELKTPRGKHDGTVQGKRYFSCRPGHGLLVRPSKVYVRGINGSKLITAD